MYGIESCYMSRFLVILFALIIGTPDCWCCVLMPEPVQTHSCCVSGKNSPDTSNCPMHSDQKGRSCVCQPSHSQRDAAFVAADVPSPFYIDFVPQWVDADFSATNLCKHVPRHEMDDGPQRESTPLFVRHHALLL